MPELSPTESESFADRMIRRILIAYPNQAPKVFSDEFVGKEAWDLWRQELKEMVRRFGERRIESSLTNWIRRNEYMPEISQVRDGIEPNPNPESRFDEKCECRGLGWITIPAEGKRPQSVKKCDCYKRKARVA